jgi:potassium transporter
MANGNPPDSITPELALAEVHCRRGSIGHLWTAIGAPEIGRRRAFPRDPFLTAFWSRGSPIDLHARLGWSSWNRGAEQFKGYSEGEITGQHFSRFYTEEDRPSIFLKPRCGGRGKRVGFEEEAWWVLGQGALLLSEPRRRAIRFSPFFPWALIPVVVVRTVATIIASQAVISRKPGAGQVL